MSKFLKWKDDIIGIISDTNEVSFTEPHLNSTVELYTAGKTRWSSQEFAEFLQDRIVSPHRRDIQRLLFRCGLSQYDVFAIANKTRAVNAGDLLWLSKDKNELFTDTMEMVFKNIFKHHIDEGGYSVNNSPGGCCIKSYGSYNNNYGIIKKRLSPAIQDAEAEVAAYQLATLMQVPCCPAIKIDDDHIFSMFKYDFTKEYIVHFRRIFEPEDSALEHNTLYELLMQKRPEFHDNYVKMILFDFITRQDDRHLSNFSIKVAHEYESFYDLYDNGRSLCCEESSKSVKQLLQGNYLEDKTFGLVGTYQDIVNDILKENTDNAKLLNLNITDNQIYNILNNAGFDDFRIDANITIIRKAIIYIEEKVEELENN